MLGTLAHSFEHTLTITAFVLSMMLLIEYLTVRTQNKFLVLISSNEWWQVVLASFLGIIPGCLGTFFAVSLYSHRVIKLPALIAVMIATSGDEAFVMFGEIPKQALMLNLVLFVVAVGVGFLLNLIMKDVNYIELKENMLHTHKTPDCVCFDKKTFKNDWKNLSFERFLLVFFSFLILIFFISKGVNTGKWDFETVTFIIIMFFVLFLVITVPEHFLKEHLWKHNIKKHLFRIFLWTFGSLFFINLILPYLHITQQNFAPLAHKYYFLLLLFAVLVGIIPESGPNLVFVFLYAQGYVPISILLANSIVQDGHGSLPLLAESQKSFFVAKIVNIIVGFVVGLGAYFLGF
jgi:hypothetical protein